MTVIICRCRSGAMGGNRLRIGTKAWRRRGTCVSCRRAEPVHRSWWASMRMSMVIAVERSCYISLRRASLGEIEDVEYVWKKANAMFQE